MKLDALLAYVGLSALPWALNRQPQLGLFYLAQFASDAGFAVRVDTLSSNDAVAARLIRLLRDADGPILGLYVDHDNQWELRRVVSAVKRALPQVEVVLGGPQATWAPEDVLRLVPEAACAALGEGEETFVELLHRRPLTPSSLAGCRGVAYLAGGALVRTPPRAPLADLDRLSIPRRKELSVEPSAADGASLMVGRGCVGQCAFCSEASKPPGAARKVRLRSVERCLEEVDYLVTEFQPRCISFLDDTLVSAPERLRQLCRGLVARYHGEVKWFCEARADALHRHPDLLPLMIEAGLVRVQLGGESGSQRVLDAYGKGTTLEQLRAVVRQAHAAGLVSCYVNFILGGAFETRETYEATRDFACELLELAPGVVGVGHSYFTPYPGTAMHADPAAYGLHPVDGEAVTGLGDQHVFCRTDALARMDILQLGPDFERHVARTMDALWPTLPDATVARMIEAHERWEVRTEWYDRLPRHPELYVYHHARVTGRCRRLSEVEVHGLDAAIPLRTVELQDSAEGRYLVRSPRHELLHVDPIDGMLLELSAGKLTFSEIVSTLADRLEGAPTEELAHAARSRLAALEEERLILWRPAIEG